MPAVSAPDESGGRDPRQWVTLSGCKKVLVVVHTVVYGQRLQDVIALLRADLRVRVVFTVAPHAFNAGVSAFLGRLGGAVLPWGTAVRTEFDLVLAAGSQGLEQVSGPLVRMPHGAGHMKMSRPHDGKERSVGGLGRDYLTWQGRVLPQVVALAHRDDVDELGRWCPEALSTARVVGDASYDRIAAGLHLRAAYREALGVAAGEQLVLVCSTWGTGSSFNRLDALLPRIAAELPADRYRTAVLVHPNVWALHGAWQVRSWVAGTAPDVSLVPPFDDWRPLLAAADLVIGDHGSVTLYASMVGVPILVSRYPHQDVNPRSPGARLAWTAPALVPGRPLAEQLAYAAEQHRQEDYAAIAAGISSEPGRFNRNMRKLLYRVLELGCPAYEIPVEPPMPPARLARCLLR
jgi:hypothetical protein